jgi:hypothetical protein
MRFSAFFVWDAAVSKGAQAFCLFGLVWAKRHDVDLFKIANKERGKNEFEI